MTLCQSLHNEGSALSVEEKLHGFVVNKAWPYHLLYYNSNATVLNVNTSVWDLKMHHTTPPSSMCVYIAHLALCSCHMNDIEMV